MVYFNEKKNTSFRVFLTLNRIFFINLIKYKRNTKYVKNQRISFFFYHNQKTLIKHEGKYFKKLGHFIF